MVGTTVGWNGTTTDACRWIGESPPRWRESGSENALIALDAPERPPGPGLISPLSGPPPSASFRAPFGRPGPGRLPRGGARRREPLDDPNRREAGGENGRGPQEDSAKRRMAAAYQGAVEAVFAVVLPTLLGWWVDGKLGTSPTFLLIGIVLGFAAFFVRLWRLRSLMDGSDGGRPPESQ